MKKVKQRNWLLVITMFLFSASALLLLINARRNLGLVSCLHNGVEYGQNELIPDYYEKENCYCSGDGEIVCDDMSVSYESFSSESLLFSYDFRNFLEKDMPDTARVKVSDIDHVGDRLEVVLERETLCSENEQAPTQIGMYEKSKQKLILTTVTNRDESLYGRSCVITNTFTIDGFSIGDVDDFVVFYMNEDGMNYSLNTCFFNDRLYGEGDVFKDTKGSKLCTCESWGIECENL